MSLLISRRRLLTLALLSALPRPVGGEESVRRGSSRYELRIGVLFDLFTYTISGNVLEEIDAAAGRYRVSITGEGTGVTGGVETSGIIRDGRFLPVRMRSGHTVRGRESRVQISYDHDRGLAEYHSVSYTFLLGRRRQADDIVRFRPGEPVDDLVSAELNFAARKLPVEPDGAYRITVVRRARPADEGPDDVSSGAYRAELTTFRFRPETSDAGRLTALIDLTGFSPWARASRPAQITFSPERRLESVRSSLILGTTFTLHRNISS